MRKKNYAGAMGAVFKNSEGEAPAWQTPERPEPSHEDTARDKERKRRVNDIDIGSRAAADPRFKIWYFVPHSPQDPRDASVLGWYSSGLHNTSAILRSTNRYAADIRELSGSYEEILLARSSRRIWLHCMPVQIDALEEVKPLLPSPFQVYLTNNSEIASRIDELIRSSSHPCLHVSSEQGERRVLDRTFTEEVLARYVSEVLASLEAETRPEWADISRISKEFWPPTSPRRRVRHKLKQACHNVTEPNEIALVAFGWKLGPSDPITKRGTNWGDGGARYVSKICSSADAVTKARRGLIESLPMQRDYRYVVAVPGHYWGLNEVARQLKVNGADADRRRALKRALKQALRQTSYMEHASLELLEQLRDPIFGFFMRSRALDASVFTAGLARLSAMTLAPVLRLEPRVRLIRREINQLADCARGMRPPHAQWKVSRLAVQLGARMRSLVDKQFLERIDADDESKEIEGLKIVADVPLELMPSRGVPLSLRFDVSRIPVMPGNLFYANCIEPPKILPLEAFRQILIVRSFRPDDRLRRFLEVGIDAIPAIRTGKLPLEIKFIDVTNEDELVEAINAASGAILIFDGHGTYDASLGMGAINIMGKVVDVWALKERCQLPPIVMFSACDTQPLDGSHSSTATAAFSLGAQAVLATTLPVSADWSAMLIARLLFRVADFLPVAVENSPHVTWREIVSGMLRMTYTSEVLDLLARHTELKIDGEVYRSVQLQANIAINLGRADWHSSMVAHLAAELKCSPESVSLAMRQWASFTESLKYVQLGSPENIVITKGLNDDEIRAHLADRAQRVRSA